MAIAFLTVNVRHERRLRLLFSANLAVGAFASVAFYTVVSADDSQVSPNVVAAQVLPGTPNAVDILLDANLVDGAIYNVSANAVPALDASVTPTPSALPIRLAQTFTFADVEVPVGDVDALVYGEDLLFDGNDFVEGPDGDLGTITGPNNAITAMDRRVISDGLAWDDTYGPKADELVNGPPRATLLKGRVIQQVLRDDRAAEVSVDVLVDTTKPGDTYLNTTVKLVGSNVKRDLKSIHSPTSA